MRWISFLRAFAASSDEVAAKGNTVTSDLSDDLREIKTRVGILEQQYASMSNRVDQIESRLERIERRLELAKA